MIPKKYNVQELIGKGKFGTVYLGENNHTKEKVAIKIEDKCSEISVLKNETRILEYLSRNGIRTQIPQVFWFGIYNDIHYALIMTYFVGESLEDQYRDTSLQKINDWFVSTIHILEKIHMYGVIHRDIKPAHFIFVKKWVLIDFGFATFFTPFRIEDAQPVHFCSLNSALSEGVLNEKRCKKSEYIIGTPNYISLNIHNGIKYTPIDDIWSVVYIYIRILLPELFLFTIETPLENKYPPNHILNTQNQIRKERKESFNNPVFWEKISFFEGKDKIIQLVQLLLVSSTTTNVPYTKIRNVFFV